MSVARTIPVRNTSKEKARREIEKELEVYQDPSKYAPSSNSLKKIKDILHNGGIDLHKSGACKSVSSSSSPSLSLSQPLKEGNDGERERERGYECDDEFNSPVTQRVASYHPEEVDVEEEYIRQTAFRRALRVSTCALSLSHTLFPSLFHHLPSPSLIHLSITVISHPLSLHLHFSLPSTARAPTGCLQVCFSP